MSDSKQNGSNRNDGDRLVLVFDNDADRTTFFRQVLKATPIDRSEAEPPAWTLVRNWRTEGGDDVPL